ncbi:MAG: adenine nucleotide alpha hydrolase [Armatimonadota bacterium]|nr:MAG: adenine nucleotide alpha hydrolase [Armatimonadota bacterium]
MDRPQRALAAWSSGKDALWALHTARQRGIHIVGLLTTITDPYGRVSMHGVREELVRAQAVALGLPLMEVRIPAQCTNQIYDEIMGAAVRKARSEGITGVVFGDIHLADVRAYREERMARVGMKCYFPLWGRDSAELAQAMIAAGLQAYITCLDPRQAPRAVAGRPWDGKLLASLPDGVDPLGENGEFHTFAVAGPELSSPIGVELGEVVERGGFVFADLVPA